MPYVKNSQSKPGYHVTAKPGPGHPINLKTRPVMDKIFRRMGFQQKTGISHDLCWALYDAGLLYTENSVDTTDDGTTISYNLTDLSLPEDQRDQLARLLQKHSDDTRIESITSLLADTNDFQERLERTSPDDIEEPAGPADQFTDIVDKIYGDSESVFDDPAIAETLDEWDVYLHDANGDAVSRTELTDPQATAITESIDRARDVGLGWDNIRFTDHYVQYTATGLSSDISSHLGDDTYIFKLRDFSVYPNVPNEAQPEAVNTEIKLEWGFLTADERVQLTRTYTSSGYTFETAFEPHLSELLMAGVSMETFKRYRAEWIDVVDRAVDR